MIALLQSKSQCKIFQLNGDTLSMDGGEISVFGRGDQSAM